MPEAALVIESLSKRYGPRGHGRLALDDLHLTVPAGMVFAYIGPNGAGKTTTLKAVLGLIAPTTGAISILGGAIGDRAIRARIGYLPEEPVLHPFLTVRDLLGFYAQLFGYRGAQLLERVAVTVRLVEMEDRQDQRLADLSKGLRQRVLLGQALINDPELILLDEPQSGLDPVGIQHLRQLLLDLKAAGKTVFLNSHQLTEVEQVADRIAILKEGKLVREGAVSELIPHGRWRVVVAGLGLQAGDRVMDQCNDTSAATAPGETLTVTVQQDSAGNLLFRCRDAEVAQKVMAAAQAAGGRLVEFGEDQDSLEHFFLELMGARGSDAD